mmetsp:Transcript_72972/g.194773  ORF Transcript_72972/g.194773 Transcript_72972/m.194773 type:complete len:120 (+) Transcript_72972:16-375(+)
MEEDPVVVIQTLQAYKAKLSAQIETLRLDISACQTFQAKYGGRAWKPGLEQMNKSLDGRKELLKEITFQLDLVSAQMRQGRVLCRKLRELVGPPVREVSSVPANRARAPRLDLSASNLG